jgi:hypothetical protein
MKEVSQFNEGHDPTVEEEGSTVGISDSCVGELITGLGVYSVYSAEVETVGDDTVSRCEFGRVDSTLSYVDIGTRTSPVVEVSTVCVEAADSSATGKEDKNSLLEDVSGGEAVSSVTEVAIVRSDPVTSVGISVMLMVSIEEIL